MFVFLDLFRLQNDEKRENPFEFSFHADNFPKSNVVDPFQFYTDDNQFLNSQQQQQQQQQQQFQTNSLYHQQMNDNECYFVHDNDVDQIPQQTLHCVGWNNSLAVSSSNPSMTLSKIDNNSNIINEPSQSFFINTNIIDINVSNAESNTESHTTSPTTNHTIPSTTTTTNTTTISPYHSVATFPTFPNQHLHDTFHNFHINKHLSNELCSYYISSNFTFQRRNYRKPKSFLVKALKDYVQYKHTTQKSIAHQIGIRLVSCLSNNDHSFRCDF
jgi:hypothetical protein